MSRQLLAKVGVFVLIVVNLGAYYVFWPDSHHGSSADKSDGPGKSLQMASNASAAQPGDPWKPSGPFAETPAGSKITEQKPTKPVDVLPVALASDRNVGF